jgi:hypothetical protein
MFINRFLWVKWVCDNQGTFHFIYGIRRMSYMPRFLEWSNHKLLFIFNKSNSLKKKIDHIWYVLQLLEIVGMTFVCKIGVTIISVLKFQHFILFSGWLWVWTNRWWIQNTWGCRHRVQISLYNYRFFTCRISSVTMVQEWVKNGSLPVFFLDHGQKWFVARFLRCTMVKDDDSLVWHHQQPYVFWIHFGLQTPPCWVLDFSSRVHLGVLSIWSFSLAQTHLSTMLIEDNYAKRTW